MSIKENLQRKFFRSDLEYYTALQLAENGLTFNYEPKWGKLEYTIPAKKSSYLPDFYVITKSGKVIIIECKGIWPFEDRYKHLLIKKKHPDLDIRFVFSNSKNKIRKGSKTTYADICEGKGRGFFKNITWKYSDKKIPSEWLNE